MIHQFKIERLKDDRLSRYVIKRKSWLLPPFYNLIIMTKNEFFGDLTHQSNNILKKEIAYFNKLDDAYEALHQHAQINGITEVLVKISEN